MKKELLNILACPRCRGYLSCKEVRMLSDNEIESGELRCEACNVHYPIINTIPRFVPISNNYTDSFGYQWNTYKLTQIDRFAKNNASRDRLHTETGWDMDKMSGQWMLDAGCGNGRFLDIATETKAQVVGLDMSNAVDAAYELLKDRKNLHLVQADMCNPPFKANTFDYVYSIGVIQHTPSPERSIKSIAALVKKGGQLAVTIYEKKNWTTLNAKYWIRPITKHMNDRALLFTLKLLSPILFPLTEILYRLPFVGRGFKFAIPYANYVHLKEPIKYRYSLAILDTFDMLSPAYDQPQRQGDVERYFIDTGIQKIKRLPNSGLNLVGEKVA